METGLRLLRSFVTMARKGTWANQARSVGSYCTRPTSRRGTASSLPAATQVNQQSSIRAVQDAAPRVTGSHRRAARHQEPRFRLGLTSGTVSVRVDRLAGRGVVVREDDPDDRRVQLVRLTGEGLRLFDDIAPVHLANEDRLLSALNPAEQEQLAGLLRRLLTSFEDSQASAAGPLGAELCPAHIARSRRHAVGLSDPPGMLVAAPPLPGTPAAQAGLRQGDLITAVNDREIRSSIGLAEVLSRAAPGAPLRVSILRGQQPRQLQLTPPCDVPKLAHRP